MNAKINIKTPAGKSLEGFPFEGDVKPIFNIDYIRNKVWSENSRSWVQLHKGDTIMIEIL